MNEKIVASHIIDDNGTKTVTSLNLKKVVAVQDESGRWYVIPAELREEFRNLLERSTDTRLSDDEMYNAQDQFIDKFSQYRTDGDLNNVQLYSEI